MTRYRFSLAQLVLFVSAVSLGTGAFVALLKVGPKFREFIVPPMIVAMLLLLILNMRSHMISSMLLGIVIGALAAIPKSVNFANSRDPYLTSLALPTLLAFGLLGLAIGASWHLIQHGYAAVGWSLLAAIGIFSFLVFS